MKTVKKCSALLLALFMLLSLCACGAAQSGKDSAYQTSSAAAPAAAYSTNGAMYDSFEAEEAVTADYDTGLGMSAAPVPSPSEKESGAGSDIPAEKPDKIIYSSEVTVETTAFDETVGKVTGLVEAYGGWIESSSVSGSNYYQKSRGTAAARSASYSLRIPSARFSELMDRLSDLGNIPYSHTYTENVTSQYYDAQARLKAYTTQEERLLEMMELAESVEDVIIIEDRLTELRYKIESIQSNLNNWDRRVSYSTVFLTVQEVKEYTPEEKVNPTYGEELRRALKDGLRNAGEFLKNLLVFLVELLPVLLILIPLLWLAVWLIRKIISGSKARSAKRAERKQRKLEEKLAKARAKQDLTASPAAQPAEKAEAPSQQEPSAEEAEEKSKG